MRANYRYIPYLYCANHPYTALIEVRPRLGANVSVATIVVDEEIRLLDFTLKNIPKSMSKVKINFLLIYLSCFPNLLHPMTIFLITYPLNILRNTQNIWDMTGLLLGVL